MALAITPIVAHQLGDLLTRERNPNQNTVFSFSRFLMPHLMDYQGWAIFMDYDMLARGDIAELWALRNERYTLMCVQHEHVPNETVKFLGAVQTRYEKKLELADAVQLQPVHRPYAHVCEHGHGPAAAPL